MPSCVFRKCKNNSTNTNKAKVVTFHSDPENTSAMAPTEQNIGDADIPHSQAKMRLKSDTSKLIFENNNKVIDNSDVKQNDVFNLSKYEAMEFEAQWRWPDTIVQLLLHATSLYAVYLILTLQVKFLTIFFAFMTIYTSGFGITAGVHRLWSHRAYKARLPMRILLAVLFTITGQRDIYTWALDHRVHHKYTETVADPHNINRGFWFAHVGWLVLTPHPAVEDRRAALRETSLDLLADPVVRLQQKLFIPMFAVLNVALPTLIPWYLGDSLQNSFLVSFVLRFTITLNIAFSVNSFAHLWGNQPYDRFVKSVENGMVSLAALGEGWHNYHHVFPWDYRTSELGRINISTTFIDICQRIGWAYDLKYASPSTIADRARRCGDGSLGLTEEPHPEDKIKQ